MSLENLKNIFEQAGLGGGIQTNDPTPAQQQSPNIDKNLFESKLTSELILGNPNTTTYELGTGTYSGADTFKELDGENIKKRTFSENFIIGQNQRLGENNFKLETLYNVNQTANTNRTIIDTGVKDPNSDVGGNIEINTGRAGIGSLGNLDIKGYSSGFRTSLLGPEPYVVNDIGSKTNSIGNDRDLIPFTAALEDTSRLAKFYTSPAGLAFVAK